jgi:DNA-binding GntR family transcriptional regulator
MNRPAALDLVEPLDRQTLGGRAYAQLSDLLISGRMAPGEKISLRQAAEVLGVSIMPVREAVSRLVADGALEVTPNRAVRVRLMTAAQFRDLTQARIAIEGHVAGLAAVNRNDSDLKSIARAEAAMRTESRAAKPNLPRAVELNKSFHFAVYNPERLAKGDAVRFHANVLAAIKAGDEAGAREGIAADISNAAEVILSRGGLAEQ